MSLMINWEILSPNCFVWCRFVPPTLHTAPPPLAISVCPMPFRSVLSSFVLGIAFLHYPPPVLINWKCLQISTNFLRLSSGFAWRMSTRADAVWQLPHGISQWGHWTRPPVGSISPCVLLPLPLPSHFSLCPSRTSSLNYYSQTIPTAFVTNGKGLLSIAKYPVKNKYARLCTYGTIF